MQQPRKVLKREGVQLAYPADEGKIRRLGDYFLVQPKLNGERCRVEWFQDEPVLLSSYGNEFLYMDHIKDDLKKYCQGKKKLSFDGELYYHGWNFSKIHSTCSRKTNENLDTRELQFHIFDYQDEEKAQISRSLVLSNNIPYFEASLQIVPTYRASYLDWMQYTNHFISDGYEGIILRNLGALYQKKRTVNMLKYKPTEEDDYLILDLKEAMDKEGENKGMVGSFLVCGADNPDDTFYVGAGKIPHEERVKLWLNRGSVKGATLKVKHEPTTTVNRIPVCCVAVEVIL